MKKFDILNTATTREGHNNQMHFLGRCFTWASLILICLVPIVYCISAGVMPDWKTLGACMGFVAGYWVIGLIEAFSYAPLLGTGGQYLSFITGNVANLKLPASLNAQTVAKVEQGSEEQEIISTISIAISSIVTTVIIAIGLIPLAIFQAEIVEVLKPISPYVVPAIFGGLTMALLAKYFKAVIIPFVLCIIICVVGNLIGLGSSLNQSTMIIVGMVLSGISTVIIYKLEQKRATLKEPKKEDASTVEVKDEKENVEE